MAVTRVSVLTPIAAPQADDLFYVSQALGGSLYASRKLTYGNLLAKLRSDGIAATPALTSAPLKAATPVLTSVPFNTIFKGYGDADRSNDVFIMPDGDDFGTSNVKGRLYCEGTPDQYVLKSSGSNTLRSLTEHTGGGRTDGRFFGYNSGTSRWEPRCRDGGAINATLDVIGDCLEYRVSGGSYYLFLPVGVPFVLDAGSDEVGGIRNLLDGGGVKWTEAGGLPVRSFADNALFRLTGSVGNLFSA